MIKTSENVARESFDLGNDVKKKPSHFTEDSEENKKGNHEIVWSKKKKIFKSIFCQQILLLVILRLDLENNSCQQLALAIVNDLKLFFFSIVSNERTGFRETAYSRYLRS